LSNDNTGIIPEFKGTVFFEALVGWFLNKDAADLQKQK